MRDRGRHYVSLSVKKAVRAFARFVFDRRGCADLPLTMGSAPMKKYLRFRSVG
jgi:hypothetical protein